MLSNNKRFKQLIKAHGDVWELLDNPRIMPCCDFKMGVPIQSIRGLKHMRNIGVGDVEFLD